MTTPTQALIAARPLSLRYSLLALLARLPQIDAVQSVEDLPTLLTVVSAIQPRLVVLDVDLTGEQTALVLEQIRAIAPQARTVVLVDRVELQQELLAAPVDLVLLKGYPAAELFARLERLLAQNDRDMKT